MSEKSRLARKLMFLLPAAVLLGMLSAPSAGCGDPCVSLCEDAKGCNMLASVGFVDDMGNPVSDCASYCEDTRTANEEIGCGNEFDDFMSCFSSFDVCQDFGGKAAVGLCLSRTNYNVEIEHWLLKLLETPTTDLQSILHKIRHSRESHLDPI